MSGDKTSLDCVLIRFEYELEKLRAITTFGVITVVVAAIMQLLTAILVALAYLNFVIGMVIIVSTGVVAIAINKTLPYKIAEKKLRLKHGEKIDECFA